MTTYFLAFAVLMELASMRKTSIHSSFIGLILSETSLFVACKSSSQYKVSLHSFWAIESLCTKSALLSACSASRWFAATAVPALSNCLAITPSSFATFKKLQNSTIATANPKLFSFSIPTLQMYANFVVKESTNLAVHYQLTIKTNLANAFNVIAYSFLLPNQMYLQTCGSAKKSHQREANLIIQS